MIAFVSGKVHSYTQESVLIDNHGIGYRIMMSNPSSLSLGETVLLYTYQHIREDAQLLFGFIKIEEHDLFLRLLSVKGIGPKIAINAIGIGGSASIIHAIETNDIAFLKKLPGIGAKASSQIVLDLKGKLVESEQAPTQNEELDFAIEALKSLGYKSSEITAVVKTLRHHPQSFADDYIKQALALLAK
ncbi:MAG: Holliday junction branch migration protein RuvA [Breznakia sp.]